VILPPYFSPLIPHRIISHTFFSLSDSLIVRTRFRVGGQTHGSGLSLIFFAPTTLTPSFHHVHLLPPSRRNRLLCSRLPSVVVTASMPRGAGPTWRRQPTAEDLNSSRIDRPLPLRSRHARALPASPDSPEPPPPPVTIAGRFPARPRLALPQHGHPLHGVPCGRPASTPTSCPPSLLLSSPLSRRRR
jgi:hypothetical protein